MEKEIVIVRLNETFMQSFYKDLATFGFLSLFAWVSKDSTFWMFVCGCICLVMLLGQVIKHGKTNVTLKTKKQAQEWVNSLPDDK